MITKYAFFAIMGLAVLDFSLRVAGYTTQEIYGPVTPPGWVADWDRK